MTKKIGNDFLSIAKTICIFPDINIESKLLTRSRSAQKLEVLFGLLSFSVWLDEAFKTRPSADAIYAFKFNEIYRGAKVGFRYLRA